MGTAHSIMLKNTTIHGVTNAMDRKNINRDTHLNGHAMIAIMG